MEYLACAWFMLIEMYSSPFFINYWYIMDNYPSE